MASFYTELTPELQHFIGEQRLFFTATAPLSPEGRINLSPKGIDTFRCLDPHTVAYLDLTGSGNETAAHIHENGRLTIMFCSFTQQPLILRLYGRGEVVSSNHPDWESLHAQFDPVPGERQIVRLHLQSAQTSCGFGVPLYEFQQDRQTLIEWAARKGEAGVEAYRRKNNTVSIDGLSTHLFSD
jgi:hypothetical protein